MDEQIIYAMVLEGLFPEAAAPIRVHGTAGEILEKVADEWGLEDDENLEFDFSLDGVYPSTRAVKAHQMLEDRLGKSGAFDDPDKLMNALIKEGLVRQLTDDEYESWLSEEEMEEYEEARTELDEEWSDGLWEK
jgi:hypothetical protein